MKMNKDMIGSFCDRFPDYSHTVCLKTSLSCVAITDSGSIRAANEGNGLWLTSG